jgi:transposase
MRVAGGKLPEISKPEESMSTPTTQESLYMNKEILYMAIETSAKKWRLAFSRGGERIIGGEVKPGDKETLHYKIGIALKKLKLPPDAKIVSCYEAGQDGFWIHRFLAEEGIENTVIDAASLKVDRRKRRAKNDRIDVRLLLRSLVHYTLGEKDVWKVVVIPSEEDEDDRRLHRELEHLKKERGQHRSRIRMLLATQGCRPEKLMRFLKDLDNRKNWNEKPLPPSLAAEIGRQYKRLLQAESDIKDVIATQKEQFKKPTSPKLKKVVKLEKLRGIGLDSAWLITMEMFWRSFNSRRQVGGWSGLTGTPFDSGEMDREQGISKAGNSRVRTRTIELAWLWIRYQPNSDLTHWFNKRFAAGGKRVRRIGIVGVARRLLIELWHYVEHDVEPKGALISN